MKRRGALAALLLLLLAGLWHPARAQNLEFHPPGKATDPRTALAMRDLAQRMIPVYQDPDRQRYLANLSALQLVAGSDAAAYAARLSLADLHRRTPAGPWIEPLAYDLHARARALVAEEGIPYAQGFSRSFQAAVSPLDDLSAYRLIEWLKTPPAVYQDALQRALDQRRGQDRISMPDALALIWTYLAFDAHRSFAPYIPALAAADDQRRYVTDGNVLIHMRGGASLSGLLVRPRNAAARLPTLLTLTLEPGHQGEALETAAHGYAGLVARPLAQGSDPLVPYEHATAEAHAVLGWIAAQPWSDGRVGMYGSGYSAFTAWAAARRAPPALQALLVASAIAPGIDGPMEGGIFRNAACRWLISLAHPQDEAPDGDPARGRQLDARWYVSGRPYRELDRLFGSPSAVFQRWLHHPSYDRYWRSMIPGPRDLARLSIPVLTLTGYYDALEAGALYYFSEHHRYNAHADDTLLVGPYDSEALVSKPPVVLGGYPLDPAALIDLGELRYQWFDHVLRQGPRPPVLAGRVNYELMGADTWRHVGSLDAASGALTLHLVPGPRSGLLQRQAPDPRAFIQQTVDLAARAPVPQLALAPQILTGSLISRDSVAYVSDPLPQALDLAGQPTLQLDFRTNKRDLDLTVTLYEQLTTGQYLKLYSPAYEQRASYARDRSARRLLVPGARERLILRGPRLVGRRVQAGSRLVLVLGVKKRPDEEINYGTGKDVSQESLADARRPLTIRWYGESHLALPLGR